MEVKLDLGRRLGVSRGLYQQVEAGGGQAEGGAGEFVPCTSRLHFPKTVIDAGIGGRLSLARKEWSGLSESMTSARQFLPSTVLLHKGTVLMLPSLYQNARSLYVCARHQKLCKRTRCLVALELNFRGRSNRRQGNTGHNGNGSHLEDSYEYRESTVRVQGYIIFHAFKKGDLMHLKLRALPSCKSSKLTNKG